MPIKTGIIHRDYSNSTDVIIKIYDNNIEFSNAGKLLGGLTIADLEKDNYQSIHRNKLLAEAFYFTGDIEKYGTGFKRVRQWLSAHGGLELSFYQISGFFRTIVAQKNSITLSDELNERQKSVLILIKNTQGIKGKDISKLNNIPIDTVDRYVKLLAVRGLMERRGSKKTGGYFYIGK